MEIRYSKKAQKVIKAMDSSTKQRIRNAILDLTKEPPSGDIKPMEGNKFKNCFRVKVGQYRIIYQYEIDETVNVLSILRIGARGDVYK